MLERHATLQQEYDRWHEGADPNEDPRQRKQDAWLFDLLRPTRGSLLLDVACGRGRFLGYAAEHGLRVAGVDISNVATLEDAGLEVRSWHTWNYVFASQKVSATTMRIWNAVARFVPKHAGLHFVYLCSVGR